jgi:hypothetical protein
MRLPQTWSYNLFIKSRTLWLSLVWLPAQDNGQVHIRDGGGIEKEDQEDYSGHPEVPINCSFSRVTRMRGQVFKD